MSANIFNLATCVAVASLLAACGGGGGGAPANGTVVNPGGGTPPATRQVVVVGDELTAAGLQLGKMWVNGVEKALPVGENGKGSLAMSVAWGTRQALVAGTYPYNGGLNKVDSDARLWYDGDVAQALATPFYGDHLAVAVTANDTGVYVAGNLMQGGVSKALYWKNAQPVYLTPDPENSSSAEATTGIAVVGSDVYVSGAEGLVGTVAVYWKNGLKFTLGTAVSRAQGIAVKGFDVYVAGFESDQNRPFALVWKNGVRQWLRNPANPALWSEARAVQIGDRGDVYVVGREQTIPGNDNSWEARLWKNGVQQALEGSVAGSGASALSVVGSDVYVAGYVDARPVAIGLHAALWVNGKLQRLTDGKTRVTARSVVAN